MLTTISMRHRLAVEHWEAEGRPNATVSAKRKGHKVFEATIACALDTGQLENDDEEVYLLSESQLDWLAGLEMGA